MRFRALIFKHVAAGNARRGNGPRDREPQAGCGRQPPASHACRPRAPGTSPAALCRRTPGLRNAPASRWSLPPPPDVFNRSRIRCGTPPKGLLAPCEFSDLIIDVHRFLGHSGRPPVSLPLLPDLAGAAESSCGVLEFQTGQAERGTTVCLLGHHYPSELHHLYPWEETMPGQEQQSESIICQAGAGGKGWRRKSPERLHKLKWMEVEE